MSRSYAWKDETVVQKRVVFGILPTEEHDCVLVVTPLVWIMKDPVEELTPLESGMRMLSRADASARGKYQF